MTIYRLRLLVQALSFFLLTYGGRFGVRLGYSLPCFSCPFVSGCGGYCFLMFFQRMGLLGIAAYDRLFTYIEVKTLLWTALFGILCILLSKLWCGWICPFGTVQDLLTALRQRMGINEVQLPWYVRDGIKPIKYIFLGIILLVPPFMLTLNLPNELYILFCKICPARVIMPMFVGNFRYAGLDFSTWLALVISIISLVFTAITLVGSFFKQRFFCLVCPMLPLIQLFDRFSIISFHKQAQGCTGCGSCQRQCPMEIRSVHDAKEDKRVMEEDCILCGTCISSCPQNNVLELKLGNKVIYSSQRKRLYKKTKDKGEKK